MIRHESDEASLVALEARSAELAAADEVLGRFWRELLADERLRGLTSLVPTDRRLGWTDVLPLAPVAMAHLATSTDQLRALDAVVHAYARAAGLHFLED